jgi:hypothetical protein
MPGINFALAIGLTGGQDQSHAKWDRPEFRPANPRGLVPQSVKVAYGNRFFGSDACFASIRRFGDSPSLRVRIDHMPEVQWSRHPLEQVPQKVRGLEARSTTSREKLGREDLRSFG